MAEGDAVSRRRSDSVHEWCGTSACTIPTGPCTVSIVIATGMLPSAAHQRGWSRRESPSSHSDPVGGREPRFARNQLNTNRSWLPSTTASKRRSSHPCQRLLRVRPAVDKIPDAEESIRTRIEPDRAQGAFECAETAVYIADDDIAPTRVDWEVTNGVSMQGTPPCWCGTVEIR